MWIKTLISIWRTLVSKWHGETPKAAKTVRNAAAVIAASLPAAYMAVTSMGISLPETWQYVIGGITFASVLITGIAGTKETNNARANRQNTDFKN